MSKRSHKTVRIKVFLPIFATDRRIQIRIREAQKHVDPVDSDPDSDLDPEHWFTCLSVSSLSMECRIWWAARGPGGPTYSCRSTLSRKARSMAPVRLEVVSTSTLRSFLTASTQSNWMLTCQLSNQLMITWW